MENFKQIDPNGITDNFIRAIGREWMLVTAGNRESYNAMTASWGMVGFIWGRPVAQFVIRPQRYTREFVDRRCDTKWYPQHDYHKVYIAEIERVYVRE